MNPFVKLAFCIYGVICFGQCRLPVDNYEKKMGCVDMKDGTFKVSFSSSDNASTILSRSGSTQTEYYQSDTLVYEVEWISECSYLLFSKDPREIDAPVKVTIDSISKKGYWFSISMDDIVDSPILYGFAHKK